MKFPRSLLAPLALVALLAGCNDKLTVDNYNKLRIGMRFDEVKAVLGAPTSCSDVMTVKHCTWGDERHYISVNFVADQVVLFNSENLR